MGSSGRIIHIQAEQALADLEQAEEDNYNKKV